MVARENGVLQPIMLPCASHEHDHQGAAAHATDGAHATLAAAIQAFLEIGLPKPSHQTDQTVATSLFPAWTEIPHQHQTTTYSAFIRSRFASKNVCDGWS